MAVHAAQAHRPTQLVVALRSLGQGRALVLQGEQVCGLEVPAGYSGETEVLFLLRRKPDDHWFKLWFCKPGYLAHDARTLTQRCGYSWSPIRFDGRFICPEALEFRGGPYATLVDRYYLSRSPAQQLLTFPLFSERPAAFYDLTGRPFNADNRATVLLHQWRTHWGERWDSGVDLFEPTPPPSRQPTRADFWSDDGQSILLYRGPFRGFSVNRDVSKIQVISVTTEQFTGAIYSRSGGLLGRPQVYPTGIAHMICPRQPQRQESILQVCQHGVLLQPLEISLPLKDMRVVVSLPDLGTDLSGLQVRQDERFESLLQWVQVQASKTRDDLRKILRFPEAAGLSERAAAQIADAHGLQ